MINPAVYVRRDQKFYQLRGSFYGAKAGDIGVFVDQEFLDINYGMLISGGFKVRRNLSSYTISFNLIYFPGRNIESSLSPFVSINTMDYRCIPSDYNKYLKFQSSVVTFIGKYVMVFENGLYTITNKVSI